MAARIYVPLGILKFALYQKKLCKIKFSKIVAVAGIWSPPGRQQFGSGNLRCPRDFEIRKKMEQKEMLKSYRMCRFLTPPGRQQFGSGNLRYLVFFDIRNFVE